MAKAGDSWERGNGGSGVNTDGGKAQRGAARGDGMVETEQAEESQTTLALQPLHRRRRRPPEKKEGGAEQEQQELV